MDGRSAGLGWNSTVPTPIRTPTPTLAMRLSCNFVNVYTIAYRVQYTCTRVHARIPNGYPRGILVRKSRRTSLRGSSCVSGSWKTKSPDTSTSSRRSSRGSRRGCPCRCPCRSREIPALYAKSATALYTELNAEYDEQVTVVGQLSTAFGLVHHQQVLSTTE